MFDQSLLGQFKAAGFDKSDISFLEEMGVRFPDVKTGFEKCSAVPPSSRSAFMFENLQNVQRSGWRRIGVPVEDVQNVSDHSVTCGALSEFLGFDGHVTRMMLIHDLCEAVVTDFTPHDPITKDEKFRLERLGLVFGLQHSGLKDDILALWQEFEDQKTPASHKGFDIDKLEMSLQVQVYGPRYPHLKDRLHEEFQTYVGKHVKTPEGRAFFDSLEENHPGPHPVKAPLQNPCLAHRLLLDKYGLSQ